jgi:cytidyltransferase-like protein
MLTVYTGGTFDAVHAGHVNFFWRIKQLFPDCRLVVALNTDEFIKEYKGKVPDFNYAEREQHLRMCGYVDGVVSNIGGRDSKPAILQVQPEVVAIGSDWLEKDYCKQMDFDAHWLEQQNISLIYVPNLRIVSTTELKRRIRG